MTEKYVMNESKAWLTRSQILASKLRSRQLFKDLPATSQADRYYRSQLLTLYIWRISYLIVPIKSSVNITSTS